MEADTDRWPHGPLGQGTPMPKGLTPVPISLDQEGPGTECSGSAGCLSGMSGWSLGRPGGGCCGSVGGEGPSGLGALLSNKDKCCKMSSLNLLATTALVFLLPEPHGPGTNGETSKPCALSNACSLATTACTSKASSSSEEDRKGTGHLGGALGGLGGLGVEPFLLPLPLLIPFPGAIIKEA